VRITQEELGITVREDTSEVPGVPRGTAAETAPAIDFEPDDNLFLLRFMASLGDRLVISIDGLGLW
jgi:hypothetical protein